MASCAYCNSFIVFGGRTDATGCYCGEKCQQAGHLLALSAQVPPREIDRLVDEHYHSNCPRCGGPGPIDVHKAHQVWSALILTSWSSRPELSCKSCATRRQLGALLFCAVCGWWGFPWGLILTPVQIGRNIVEMAGGSQAGVRSPLLEKFVRFQVGARLAQNSLRPPGPPPLPRTPSTPPPIPAAAQSGGDARYMPKG